MPCDASRRSVLALLLAVVLVGGSGSVGAAQARAPVTVDADQALLSRSVTVSWINATPDEALVSITAALAPRAFLWHDAGLPELRATRSTYAGSGVPLARALDALTPSGCRWVVAHRSLTLAEVLPDDAWASGIDDARSIALLRRALLAWAHRGGDGDGLTRLLEASRARRPHLPLAALAGDARVQAAVAPVFGQWLIPGMDPPLSILELAVALPQDAWVAAVSDQLRRITHDLAGDLEPAALRAAGDRQALLIDLAGAIGVGDPTLVDLLGSIAGVPIGPLHRRFGTYLLDFHSDTGRHPQEAIAVASAIRACDALARIGSPQAHDLLVQLCSRSPAAHLSWRAARALADLGAQDALPQVRLALGAAQAPDVHRDWADATDQDGAITDCADALGHLGGAAGVQTVLALLAQPEVSRPVFEALYDQRDPAILPALIALIHQDPLRLRRRQGPGQRHVLALDSYVGGLTEQPGADAALARRLQEPGLSLLEARTLLLCLGETRSPLAVDTLRAALAPTVPTPLRQAACAGLGATAQPAAVAALLPCVRADPDTAVRMEAVRSLGILALTLDHRVAPACEAQMRPTLDAAATEDHDPAIRKTAWWAGSPVVDAAHAALWTRQLCVEQDAAVLWELGAQIEALAGHPLSQLPSVRHRCLVALRMAPPAANGAFILDAWWQSLATQVDVPDLRRRLDAVLETQPVHDLAGLLAATAMLDARVDRPPPPLANRP